ncbi:MAG: OmpA family protein [Chitinispirillales bacterium]|jgi:outer membrane protein OmpA-like peptidoglycan-associated protein|nr:OmpA family protein [Chitinispirillales bacterium]
METLAKVKEKTSKTKQKKLKEINTEYSTTQIDEKIDAIYWQDFANVKINMEVDNKLSIDNILAQILCPTCDNDSDLIINLYDVCIDIPGIAEKYGCPQNFNFTRPEITGIFFALGKVDIPNSSLIYLYPFLKKLKECPESKIIIYGYTDNTGEYKDNIIISQKRADAVKDYFVSKGISKSRITATGFGANNPVADNRSQRGQNANRRIEIYWD